MRNLYLLLTICFLFGKTKICYSQELLIKATRTISFTTDDGTNMSVDVSPDGRTLVFDLLGELYTVPVTGGNATQITKGMGINLQPVWSPDGDVFKGFIVFQSKSFEPL
jgi:Tol biopolymer transport system component